MSKPSCGPVALIVIFNTRYKYKNIESTSDNFAKFKT